jgi:hypothetical protein
MQSIPAPTGLGPRGRKLWREVTGKYDLTPTELELLRSMAATVDLQSRVETKLRHAHMTSTGSAGQLIPHPLLGEHRALSDTLRNLGRQLNLPDIDRKQSPRKPKVNAGQVSHLRGGA